MAKDVKDWIHTSISIPVGANKLAESVLKKFLVYNLIAPSYVSSLKYKHPELLNEGDLHFRGI
jgi:hypothetical protein